MSSGDGIGDGMTPTAPGAPYGHYTPEQAVSTQSFNWSILPGVTQNWSASIVRDYYVYEDFGHGGDTYLVVYIENGTISPGTLASSQYLTGVRGDRDSGRAPDLAQAFIHHRIECSVAPNLTGEEVELTSHSPANVNARSNVNNQAVSTVTDTVSWNTGPDGSSSGGSDSDSQQIWHGVSFDINEWNINDVTDTGKRQAAWVYYQDQGANNEYWDGRNDPDEFSEWWQQAYNMGGGWDDVKPLCNLSSSTLTYSNTASWRFKKSLVSEGALEVTFSGAALIHVIGIAMPQLAGGHHQCNPQPFNLQWSDTLDLVAWVNVNQKST